MWQNRQRHDTREATPRNKPTALAHGLPGGRFPLFVVSQVLASLRHPERASRVERSREVTNEFAAAIETPSPPGGFLAASNPAWNEKPGITSVSRRSDSLPCNSIGNRIRSRAAADWLVGRVRVVLADNVV